MTEKEKIDYEYSKKKEFINQEITEWGCALIIVLMFFLSMIMILTAVF